MANNYAPQGKHKKESSLLWKISEATKSGYTVAFKFEPTNQLSVRVRRKLNATVFGQFDQWLPFDKDHALNEDRVCDVIDYCISQIESQC